MRKTPETRDHVMVLFSEAELIIVAELGEQKDLTVLVS
jgi:hypothetical protein